MGMDVRRLHDRLKLKARPGLDEKVATQQDEATQ